MASVIVRTENGEHEQKLTALTTIGRHPKSTICIIDPLVSKKHAVIRRTPEGYIFEDLGSSNGSFLSGIRVNKHTFREGDEITIGQTALVYKAETEEEELAKLVSISRVSADSQVQDRIQVSSIEDFLPEQQVNDLNLLRIDYEKLRLGHELMTHLGLEPDLTSTLEKITDELLSIFPANRCAILLMDVRSHKLVPRFVRTTSGDKETVSVSASVLREVQENKAAVLLADASQDDRFSEASSLIMQGIRSVMCAPIMSGSDFLGVIHMESKQAQYSFTRKDLQMLSGITRYVAMAVVNSHLVKKIEREARTKAQFERLLSPSIVEQIMSGKVKLEKGGELRDITILFADIRGFTSLSRRSSATKVVAMLNRYFETIVDVVFRYGGTVDKYIGDEVMVLFGAPLEVKSAPDQAIACALEMMGTMDQFNYERKKEGEEPIQIGIGINSGEVVVGSIGSSQTMQYTCIGDAVNVASRLVSMAKPGQIVISDNTLGRLTSKVKAEALPPLSIKGIDGSLQAHSIKDMLEDTSERHPHEEEIV